MTGDCKTVGEDTPFSKDDFLEEVAEFEWLEEVEWEFVELRLWEITGCKSDGKVGYVGDGDSVESEGICEVGYVGEN